MVSLGFSMQLKYDRPHPQVIELLHDVGFSAISSVWSPELPWEEMLSSEEYFRIAAQRARQIADLYGKA